VRSVVVVSVVLAAGVPAHAESPKSEQTAFILAGTGTGVSSALILAGFLGGDSSYPFNQPLMYAGLASAAITPSLGQFYAGEYLTIGMAARVVGVGLATYGLTHYTHTTTCDTAHMAGTVCKSLGSEAIPFLGLAAIAFVGGMAYDVGDADDAARRWNARHGFVIAPSIVPSASGPAPGLSIAGQF
jgi:hypothetical protein